MWFKPGILGERCRNAKFCVVGVKLLALNGTRLLLMLTADGNEGNDIVGVVIVVVAGGGSCNFRRIN